MEKIFLDGLLAFLLFQCIWMCILPKTGNLIVGILMVCFYFAISIGSSVPGMETSCISRLQIKTGLAFPNLDSLCIILSCELCAVIVKLHARARYTCCIVRMARMSPQGDQGLPSGICCLMCFHCVQKPLIMGLMQYLCQSSRTQFQVWGKE